MQRPAMTAGLYAAGAPGRDDPGAPACHRRQSRTASFRICESRRKPTASVNALGLEACLLQRHENMVDVIRTIGLDGHTE